MLNNKGMGLIEVLIALTVFLLVSLALMQTTLVSIDANMGNVMRDEATRIAEERLSELRDLYTSNPVDPNIVATYVPPGAPVSVPDETITRNFRVFTVPFVRQRSIGDIASSSSSLAYKQISVLVTWTWKGQSYSHSASTLMVNPNE